MNRLAFVLLLAACHTRSSTVEKHVDASTPDASASDAAAPFASLCHAPGPGELSDDESPAITKLPESTEIMPWLEARGVTRAAATSWYTARFAPNVDSSDAAMVFQDTVQAMKVTVGDKREEALVIEHIFHWGWTPEKVLVLTVRNKRLVALLDVGLGMSAMDWPGTHHLDLALDIDPGGMKMVLRDRAPAGTKIVEPPSVCREQEERLGQCRKSVAEGTKPEGWCPVVVDPDGGVRLVDMTAPLIANEYPAALTNCAHALPYFQKEVRAMAKIDPEALKAAAWIEKTCAERGTYVWKGDRFVKAP